MITPLIGIATLKSFKIGYQKWSVRQKWPKPALHRLRSCLSVRQNQQILQLC